MTINQNSALTSNFRMQIKKIPDVEYYLTSTILPGVDCQNIEVPNPMAHIFVPGLKLQYSTFKTEFLVNEDLSNYMSVYRWIRSFAIPNDKSTAGQKDIYNPATDISLNVLDNQSNYLYTINLVNCFPISLSPMRFDSQDQYPIIQRASIEFSVDWWEQTFDKVF